MLTASFRLRCLLYVSTLRELQRITYQTQAEPAPVTKEDVDTLKYDWLTDNVR
jgi:hypothetical protein